MGQNFLNSVWLSDPAPKRANEDEIIIGFDAEWQRDSPSTNRILSYQYFAVSEDGGEWKNMFQPERGKRLKLAALLKLIILEGLKGGLIRVWPRHVLVVSHFSIADMV